MLCENMGNFSTKKVRVIAYEKMDHDAVLEARAIEQAKQDAIDAEKNKIAAA